jgi:hypothetical protein
MSIPISIGLDNSAHEAPEAQLAGAGLSTDTRDLATEAARQARRARIRAESKAVAAYVAKSADARAFYRDWGTLGTDDA